MLHITQENQEISLSLLSQDKRVTQAKAGKSLISRADGLLNKLQASSVSKNENTET